MGERSVEIEKGIGGGGLRKGTLQDGGHVVFIIENYHLYKSK